MRESRSYRRPTSYLAIAALVLGAASAWASTLVTPAHAQTLPPAQMEVRGQHSVASGRAITNFNFMDAASRSLRVERPPAQIAIHRPLAGRAGVLQDQGDSFEPGDDAGMSEADAHSSKRQHRVRKADFPAGADNGAVIPPDTQGTVGPNHLMAVLNSNVTIETRTGVVLSSIPIAAFWSRDRKSVV